MINIKKLIFLLFILGIVLLFTGCVVANITENLENPFLITLSWDGKTLLPDDTGEISIQTLDEKGATVSASVEDEFGNTVIPDFYEWYLCGELLEDGEDTLYLNNTLEIGIYGLVLIVGEGSILSSVHVDFIKEE